MDKKEELDDSDWEDETNTPSFCGRQGRNWLNLCTRFNLFCLLARGRLVHSACDDPLIQASLLSLLQAHLLQLSNFHDNFHVKNYTNGEKAPHFALASALELREGSPEEFFDVQEACPPLSSTGI
ncbi:hypothetical protein P8452_12908 [Trifolium repens]|nr:hypothetical protein P8452_12908 [Trifolium repens]